MARLTTRARLAPAMMAGGLLVLPLAACTDTGGAENGTATDTTAATTDPGDVGGETTDPGQTTDAAPTTDAEPSPESTGATSSVDCSGTTCSVTLTNQDREVEVLGTTVSLESSENGQASIQVGNQQVSCSQGQTVSAGPLSLECTTVSADSVTLSASLG